MINQFKDVLLFGLGSATLAKEVAEDFVDEMIKSGQVQAQERAQLVEDFTERARSMKTEFESTLKQRMRDLAHDMHLVTRDEIEGLQERIRNLEAKVVDLEASKKSRKSTSTTK